MTKCRFSRQSKWLWPTKLLLKRNHFPMYVHRFKFVSQTLDWEKPRVIMFRSVLKHGLPLQSATNRCFFAANKLHQNSEAKQTEVLWNLVTHYTGSTCENKHTMYPCIGSMRPCVTMTLHVFNFSEIINWPISQTRASFGTPPLWRWKIHHFWIMFLTKLPSGKLT